MFQLNKNVYLWPLTTNIITPHLIIYIYVHYSKNIISSVKKNIIDSYFLIKQYHFTL